MRKRIVSIQFKELPKSYFNVDGVRELMNTRKISRIIVDVESPPKFGDETTIEEIVYFSDNPKDESLLYYNRELYKFSAFGEKEKWKIIPGGKLGMMYAANFLDLAVG